MDILSNLTKILGQSAASQGAAPQQGQAGGLGGLLSPDMLSGLLGSLMGGKAGASSAAPTSGVQAGGLGDLGGLLGSLLGAGGGGQGGGMASILSSLMGGAEAPPPPAPKANEPTDRNKAANLLRALIYAVKADGKIDKAEEQAINEQVQKLGLGADAQAMVNQFLSEPLDPAKIANNITSSDEALNIYALSCAITQMDNPVERQYLDALANAMQIPVPVRQELVRRILG